MKFYWILHMIVSNAPMLYITQWHVSKMILFIIKYIDGKVTKSCNLYAQYTYIIITQKSFWNKPGTEYFSWVRTFVIYSFYKNSIYPHSFQHNSVSKFLLNWTNLNIILNHFKNPCSPLDSRYGIHSKLKMIYNY